MSTWRRSRNRSDNPVGQGTWPCPCCGYRTLHEGPGDYELCPVCDWEDAGDQLRWPTFRDGPNAISLIEAQRNYAELGACDRVSVPRVREPRQGEEREPGWRPIDPALDGFESGPHDPQNLPWPGAEELYWWRSSYFRRPENQRPGPAPRQDPSNAAEQMMARIIEMAPETEAIDIAMRSLREEPAPLQFCGELAHLVVEADRRGETELALRIVGELDAGLASGDPFTGTCVSVGFLEPLLEQSFDGEEVHAQEGPDQSLFSSSELLELIDTWPPHIKAEVRRQLTHLENARNKQDRLWGQAMPDGSYKVPLGWRIAHPIRWRRMRRGGTGFAG